MQEAHAKHIAGCLEDSDCPNPDKHIHHIDCFWAMSFDDEFRYNEKTDEILESLNDNPLCCCGDANIKHDESTKFKLICDKGYFDYKIWKK